MTEGPTGPRTDAPDLASAASLPARSARGSFALGCCPWGPGLQGPRPRGEGGLWEQLWEPRVFPTSGRKGRKESLGQGLRVGPTGPSQADVCPLPPSLGSWLPGSEWPGQEPSGLPVRSAPPWPVSSLGSRPSPGRPGLCCTYPRLVFIPCADDTLFLLSVSVFMCAELLACCARARGELVPRLDGLTLPSLSSLPWSADAGPGVLAPEGHLSRPQPLPHTCSSSLK